MKFNINLGTSKNPIKSVIKTGPTIKIPIEINNEIKIANPQNISLVFLPNFLFNHNSNFDGSFSSRFLDDVSNSFIPEVNELKSITIPLIIGIYKIFLFFSVNFVLLNLTLILPFGCLIAVATPNFPLIITPSDTA